MKKIFSIIMVACLLLGVSGCQDRLDSVDYTEANTSNYPSSSKDVTNELAALYAVMDQLQSGPEQAPWYANELMSDDCYGSGGTGDAVEKAIAHLTMYGSTMHDAAWKLLFRGISRANLTISTIDNFAWSDKTKRNQDLGEAYFMRGLYYFWLTQYFGDVPLILTTTVPDPCPQVSAKDAIYPQILSDFVSAKNLMDGVTGVQDGHAGKYAADAMLARAWMFYVGFYGNAGELAQAQPAPITLVAQEGTASEKTLTKQNVIDALKEVVSAGKFSLVGDFRDLWQYTNHLTRVDYKYLLDDNGKVKNGVDGKPLLWAGNANKEEIFEVQYANASSWSAEYPMAFSNESTLYWGPRIGNDITGTYSNGYRATTYPFGCGWGKGTPSQNIWDDWTAQEQADGQTDIRKTASIIDCAAELTHYSHVTDCCEECGLIVKKFAPVLCNTAANGATIKDDNSTWWAYETGYSSCSNGNSMQGDHYEDTPLIRYADVLLMLTELTGDPSYMNQVRARAGLSPKPYSWTNIQNERRWEFAFEGLRWNDLRRWSGINADKNSLICKALDAQAGKPIWVNGKSGYTLKHMTSSWSQRYIETKGFYPKPSTQVSLSNGALKQNEGWNTPDSQYKTIY